MWALLLGHRLTDLEITEPTFRYFVRSPKTKMSSRTGSGRTLSLEISHESEKRSRYSDWLRAGRPRGQSSSPGG
jgi:hypothetical protein